MRAIRTMADQALENMSRRFDRMYAKTGRPSIHREVVAGATDPDAVLVRSERLLWRRSTTACCSDGLWG